MEMEGGQGPCNSTVLLSPQHQDFSSTGPLSAIAALVQVCVSWMCVCNMFSDYSNGIVKISLSTTHSLVTHRQHQGNSCSRCCMRNISSGTHLHCRLQFNSCIIHTAHDSSHVSCTTLLWQLSFPWAPLKLHLNQIIAYNQICLMFLYRLTSSEVNSRIRNDMQRGTRTKNSDRMNTEHVREEWKMEWLSWFQALKGEFQP